MGNPTHTISRLLLVVLGILSCSFLILAEGLSTQPSSKGGGLGPSRQLPNTVISEKNGLSTSFHFQDLYSPTSTTSNEKHPTTHTTTRENTILTSQQRQYQLPILTAKINSAIRSTFLPSGYPHKTPPGYLSFSIWSWFQDISTQLRGVLATQRVLEGVGVGREGATALSASLNFIVRDGCGMASTLLFTSCVSEGFRWDVKRWRMFADLINDIGITLEVMATLFPQQLFLPMICAGNMCKAMCGVAAGACNGAINLHWAKGSDISDINAKFGAQHTVTGSLGLVFAALFAKSISTTSNFTLWTLYSALTLLHIVANMKCLKLIAFDNLNTSRMNLVLGNFLSTIDKDGFSIDKDVQHVNSTPQEIAKVEPLFFLKRNGAGKRWIDVIKKKNLKVLSCPPLPIRMGVSFNELAHLSRKDPSLLQSELANPHSQQHDHPQYIVSIGYPNGKKKKKQSRNELSLPPPSCILVALGSETNGEMRAKAYLHAVLLGRALKYRTSITKEDPPEITSNNNFQNNVEEEVSKMMEFVWPLFVNSVEESGWDLSRTALASDGYEIHFS